MNLEAPDGQEFVLPDGSKLKTLAELLGRVKTMPDVEFTGFVNASKNDFANWTQYALGQELLAERLRSTSERDVTILKITEKLEEKKAEENLFAIAQNQQPPPSGNTGTQAGKSENGGKGSHLLLPLLKKKLLIKELIIGIIFGLLLGVFLAEIIRTWVF